MRPEKASIVSELSEALKRSPFVLVTDYRGMKVAQISASCEVDSLLPVRRCTW